MPASHAAASSNSQRSEAEPNTSRSRRSSAEPHMSRSKKTLAKKSQRQANPPTKVASRESLVHQSNSPFMAKDEQAIRSSGDSPPNCRPRPRSRSLSTPVLARCVAQQKQAVAPVEWSYRGLTQLSTRKYSLPTCMPPAVEFTFTPPATPPNVPHQPYSLQRAATTTHSSPACSVEAQSTKAEDSSYHVCRHCQGEGTLDDAQLKAEKERERQYLEIRKSNHELRKMLDVQNKRMSVIFEQFRREQESSEASTRRMSDLEAALEEAQARQLDLMEQNHVLRSNSISVASEQSLLYSSQPMIRKSSSPIDRQLEMFEIDGNLSRTAELESRIEGLLDLIQAQNAKISQLTREVQENAEVKDDLENLSIQLGRRLSHGRRGAVSVTPDSCLGQIIDGISTAHSSPDSSPCLARAIPVTKKCMSPTNDADDEDEECQTYGMDISSLDGTNGLKIYYTPPSRHATPVSTASERTPTSSLSEKAAAARSQAMVKSRSVSPRSAPVANSARPLKPAKRLPRPQTHHAATWPADKVVYA